MVRPPTTKELDAMSTTKTLKVTTAALAFAAVLVLTGCSPDAPATTPTATSSSTPAPVAKPVVIKSDATLTAAQLTALPENVRAYTMTNGTKVATVQDVAVPARVVADVTAKAQATIAGGLGAGNGTTDQNIARTAALTAWLKDVGVATGRQVIAIYPIYGGRTVGAANSAFWTTTVTNAEFFDTAAQAQAGIASIVAVNPAGNVVVVLAK